MSLALQKDLTPGIGYSTRYQARDADQKLEITVVFTSVKSTLIALKTAAALADRLSARITLMVPQVVPFPAQLESPPVLREFNEHRFRVLARDSQVDMSVHVCLCRDRFQELNSRLKIGSIIVLGGPRKWWATSDERLAQQLHRAGYEVIFKQTE